MKLFNETTLMVMAKAEPAKSKDGNNTYYKVACLQNGQATNLSVTQDVYDGIPDGMVEVRLQTSYDDVYKSFKVERIIQIISVNGVKPDVRQTASATASK